MKSTREDGRLPAVRHPFLCQIRQGRGEKVSAVHSNASQGRRLCRVLGTDAIARLCSYPFKPTDQGGLDPEELIPPFRI